MHRFLHLRKDETATTAWLEYSILITLIMAAAIATVFLVETLAGAQATASHVITG